MAKNKYTELDDDSKWKDKYLASLDEVEKNEQEWLASEKILRALIIHLTDAADKSSLKLNKQLEVLHEAINKGVAANKLKKAIEEIADSILGLGAIRKKKEKDSSGLLYSLIEKIKPAGKIEKKLIKLAEKLAKAGEIKKSNQLIDELANLLVYGLSLAEGKNEKNSFFSRFNKDEQDNNKNVIAVVDTEEKITDTKTSLNSNPDSNPDLIGVNKSLKALLEQMILPQDLQVEANLIKRQLEVKADENIFIDSLEKTLAIVADVIHRLKKEKKEIEDFLKQLTGRLHELDNDIRETSRIREMTHQHGQKMTAVMKTEMISMEQGISDIKDLSELKTAIQSRVINLRNHVDTFILSEGEKNKQASSVIEQLKQQVKVMEQEAEELKQQIEKERLQTLRDVLTEVPNRLAYDERLNLEFANFRRNKTAFVLIVWDIDLFKNVNDNYGHTAGDQVLKLVAKILDENSRETDFLGRYGGEEFVSILPATELNGARLISDKLRELVASSNFHFGKEPVKVTISAGFAQSLSNEDAKDLFTRADKALYVAKQKGRNNCQSAD